MRETRKERELTQEEKDGLDEKRKLFLQEVMAKSRAWGLSEKESKALVSILDFFRDVYVFETNENTHEIPEQTLENLKKIAIEAGDVLIPVSKALKDNDNKVIISLVRRALNEKLAYGARYLRENLCYHGLQVSAQ